MIFKSFRSSFSTNVLRVFSGNVIAQLINLCCYPILTRLFDSAQFGIFAVFTSVASIIGPSLSLKYDLAIPITKNDRNGMHLSLLGIVLATIATLIIFLFFYLFKSQVHDILIKDDSSSNWILLIPIAGFLIALFQNFNYWLIRKNAFSSLSINKIFQMSFIAVSSIIFGYLGIGIGLVLGYLIGNFMAVISGFYQSFQNQFTKHVISKKILILNATKHVAFPKYQAVPSLLNGISIWLPILLIAYHYGDSQAGFFSIGRQLILVPTYIISEAISKVFFKKINDIIIEKKKIGKVIKKVVYFESIVSLLFIGPAILLIKPIVTFLFGEEWSTSADIAIIIMIPALMRFVAGSISLTLISLKKLKQLSIWQIVNLCVLLLLYLVTLEFNQFLILLCITEFIMYLIYLIIILVQSNKYDKLIENDIS